MPSLTDSEFVEVSRAFISRLSNEMGSAGCNDVFKDEFPQSVCDKFGNDLELLDEWAKMLRLKCAGGW